MSDRRPEDPDDPPVAEPDDEAEDEDDEELDPVEYFVDVVVESSWVTSVPNSVHSSQTWSSAPSIFTVLGEFVSVPHISHWTGPLPVMFSPY
jgi:hypothetical protein